MVFARNFGAKFYLSTVFLTYKLNNEFNQEKQQAYLSLNQRTHDILQLNILHLNSLTTFQKSLKLILHVNDLKGVWIIYFDVT